MEKYNNFLNRISYQKTELNISGDFIPDSRLYEKVDSFNRFKPFFGDTVVFDLENEVKKRIAEIIDRLYLSSPECFCERIKPSTIHMTLHDLSASDNLKDISEDVFNNEVKLLKVLKANPQKPMTIRMKTNFIINMVSTSLVLALVPADEKEWDKLQYLYDLINKVRVCPYPFLTPHITLAYFNHNGFDNKAAKKLKATAAELNNESFEIPLSTDKLYYQKFVSMNEYISVFKLTEVI